MIRLLVDENFNGHIVDGLLQRELKLDLVHVRNVGLAEAPDAKILEWAAAHGRVLLTHDRQTVPAFAYGRVAASESMPGVFLINSDMSPGQAIDDILVAVHCLSPDECANVVRYFPL